MSTMERDALIDFVWEATCERSRQRSGLTSMELQSACKKLATLLNREHHNLALHTLMLVSRCPWSEPKQLVLEALADIPEARGFTFDLASTDHSWMLRRDAIRIMSHWIDDGSHASSSWPELFVAADDPHWRVRLAVVELAEDLAATLSWPVVFAKAQDVWLRFPDASTVRQNRINGVWRQMHVAAQRELGTFTLAPFESLAERPPTSRREEHRSNEVTADWGRDADPQVVAWELRQRFRDLDPSIDFAACRLLGSFDDVVVKEAQRRLQYCGDISMLANTFQWLDDPRHPGFFAFQSLVADMDEDRITELARLALNDERPRVQAWGLCQLAESGRHSDTESSPELVGRALQHPDAGVRAAAAMVHASRLDPSQVESELRLVENNDSEVIVAWLGRLSLSALASLPREFVERSVHSGSCRLRARIASCAASCPDCWPILAQDSSPEVRIEFAQALQQASSEKQRWLERLQQDPHSQVRCRAMDHAHATRLIEFPEQETSWAVLRQAAMMQNQSIPQRTMKRDSLERESPTLSIQFGSTLDQRVVIPGLPLVAPLGLSGHYHLPERGFHLAVEAGVGLMFFEPNYATMTRFMRSLSHEDRHRIQLVAGSFSADPSGIRSDIDRVLRLLRRDTIDLFLLFWVRDWNRVSDETITALNVARSCGAIRAYSLSTHNLTLAAEALTRGWAPVMVRHNAAHIRAEEAVLPLAAHLNQPVILFNNTCYGRLLGKRTFDGVEPSAEDCYRYSLSQPGARACWTAPATIEQLQANLAVLDVRQLDPDRRERLLIRGATIRRLDHAVGSNLRFADMSVDTDPMKIV